MSAPAPLLEVFTLESVLLELPNGSKDEILDSLVSHAISCKSLPRGRKEQVLEVLVERESRGSTAFGKGVAVPHARIKGLKKAAGIVARSSNGVDFRSIDGEPVHAFLVLISPENRSDDHLATLRWISKAVRDPDFVSFIRQAQTAEAVLDVLQERAP
jgi:mannitol/fructose-specific phosphotransferase system IIA component (Ntr-type)